MTRIPLGNEPGGYWNWTLTTGICSSKERRHHTNTDALSRCPHTATEGAAVPVNMIDSSSQPPDSPDNISPQNVLTQPPVLGTRGQHLQVLLGDIDFLATQQPSDPDIAVVLGWINPGAVRSPKGTLKGGFISYGQNSPDCPW